jgi:hypothetical protein
MTESHVLVRLNVPSLGAAHLPSVPGALLKPSRWSRLRQWPLGHALFADLFAINESAPGLHGLGGVRPWCDFVRMIWLYGVDFPAVFVVARRSVGADAALLISGRAALGGICLLCSQEKKQRDDQTGHATSFDFADIRQIVAASPYLLLLLAFGPLE